MIESVRHYWTSLDERTRGWLRPGFRPQPPLNVWQWNAANVDFSLSPSYDTPIKGPYDPNYLAIWKEPAESLTDPDVSEVIILKQSRAGASENVALNSIRYHVGSRPLPVLYVTGDQLSAESMMEERIKRGLRASKITKRKLNAAQQTQHRIMFSEMDLFVTWPKAKLAFKQRGYGLVICEELSTWPEWSADMARRRTQTYPFAHILMLSSPDPNQKRSSSDDPIFVEYKRGDRRKWFCRDPVTGSDFLFTLGTKETFGLRWSESARAEDGTWNYDEVMKSAHYVTPDGTIIYEQDRMKIVNAGRWVATNKESAANVRSYHATAFLTHFDSLGGIAVAFLKAKAAGRLALRTFFYEYLAEEFSDEITKPEDRDMKGRIENYMRGESYFIMANDPELNKVPFVRLMTVDVQKDHLWWLVREWKSGGESCLIDWGRCMGFDDVDEIANKYKPPWIGIDTGYGLRAHEVYAECMRRKYTALKGDDKARAGLMRFNRNVINPFEGTRNSNSGVAIELFTFHSDTYKLMLLDRIRGEMYGWRIYKNIERDYVFQLISEERRPDGWHRLRANHVFDLETMQLVMAELNGYLTQPIAEMELSEETTNV